MKLQLPRFLREDSRYSPHLRAKEKYKASFDKSSSTKPQRKVFYPGENSWLKRYQHYDKFADEYPLFGKACLTLAGLVTAQGLFFKPAVNRKDETYTLAEEAVYRCEQFRDTRYVNSKFYDTVAKLAKVGSCFWEITDSPTFDFRIPPLQECIEPASADDQGNITVWRQIVNGKTTAEWNSTELVLLSWNVTTGTWPYGNGIGVGLETEMESLLGMESNAKDYMEKQAWPYEILALGDNANPVTEADYAVARSEWRSRKPGEGIATYNIPVNIVSGGTGSSPIRELAELCNLMKDNTHDGLMVPPISKLYNSTEASATVLTKHIMTTLGQPIQWLIKECFEGAVLKPFLEAQGFSRKSCPSSLFESPDVHKKEEGEYWTSLVNAKIQSPQQACEHLGLEYDEKFWSELERQEQERFQQNLKAKQDSGEQKAPDIKGKVTEKWKVERIRD
jgi:hypothetical protein